MKTAGAAPSRQTPNADDWLPSAEDLKHYPHFDAPLKISEIRKIICDPQRVAQNAFFPLIQYEKKWQPFRTPQGKQKPKKKNRKIRYAARRDAYIYAKYRRILSPLYEQRILGRGVSHVPIAYRKISDSSGRGKCNIDFAKDAFDTISGAENCYVVTLDISQFFESLDHGRILEIWASLLGEALPDDHLAVYKSLTAYRWVDRTDAYRRLGYFGPKAAKNGAMVEGYLRPFDQMPKQLCEPARFRERIAGSPGFPSIIEKNIFEYGIPQGTPISDLIANLYMIDFDCYINKIANRYNGRAFRYSDDIVIIIQTNKEYVARGVEKAVRSCIARFGSQMKIKEEKSSIHRFFKDSFGVGAFEHVKGSGKNGLEYLGFRFDGRFVYLRDSTLSNLRRKLTYSARINGASHRRRYSDRTPNELIETFNFDAFFQNFMRVEEFDSSRSVKSWTFWTYARRAVDAFANRGAPIIKQLKFLKPDGRRMIEAELAKP